MALETADYFLEIEYIMGNYLNILFGLFFSCYDLNTLDSILNEVDGYGVQGEAYGICIEYVDNYRSSKEKEWD